MRAFILVLFMTFSTAIFAQESHGTHGEHHKRFKISAAMSQSYIPEFVSKHDHARTTSQFIPTNGIELEFAATKHLYFKWVNEIEFLSYSVINEAGEEAHRENAYLTALMVGVKVLPNFGVFAGAGYEFEKNEDLIVCRLGAEYIFDIGHDWVIAPAIMYDIKSESHTAHTFSFTIGKHF